MNFTKPILLIDTSYLTFYRFYATTFWFKHSKQKKIVPPNYNWIEDDVFMEKFTKLYLNSVDKILKKQKLDIPYTNFIFAQDCPRNQIWRMNLFQEYKTNRDVIYQSENWKGGAIFKYVKDTLLPKLKELHNFNIINHPQMEADDIIACITRYIQKNYKQQKIYIITSDHDYLQLIDENTTLINLKNKILNEKSCGNPKHDLLLKIICGDKADNIKSCFTKCGPKTAMKLILNPTLLEEKFQKEEGSRTIYNLNKQLIDFEFIPVEFNKQIIEKFITY